ncbi:uncharacterized protein LOC115592411 isoform X2 [Sparus aurata]|uniref:uncharacterized protein LOC115592411 isoform X2 n=1 Tax=Sparus aurata TaxID=8175 RepID=UPI0011C19B8C|nr:uncharacterized protein LOC115592411 isoform X2 [Sparus aurata]
MSQHKEQPLNVVFVLMYALYMALEWHFDFSQGDMPHLRRWLCQLLLENIQQCMKRRQLHGPQPLEEPPLHISIDMLQLLVLEDIFALVVLSDGDMAILTLSLVCHHFREVLSTRVFRRKAHFLWLNSMASWSRFSAGYRAEYCKMYSLDTCRECNITYKNCIPGYAGREKRGELQGIYSKNSHPGFCSNFCQMCTGFPE